MRTTVNAAVLKYSLLMPKLRIIALNVDAFNVCPSTGVESHNR